MYFFLSSKMKPIVKVNSVPPYICTCFVATNITSEILKVIWEINNSV